MNKWSGTRTGLKTSKKKEQKKEEETTKKKKLQNFCSKSSFEAPFKQNVKK